MRQIRILNLDSEKITEDFVKEIRSDKNVFISSDKEYALITDMKFYEGMVKKYKIEDVYTFNSIEEWIEIMYEQSYFTHFGMEVRLGEYSKSVNDLVERKLVNIECDNWDKNIDEEVKALMCKEVKRYIVSELNSMQNEGYSL